MSGPTTAGCGSRATTARSGPRSDGPAAKWVSRVVASGHDLGTAYVTLTGYRENDYRPYIFKSVDFGETWKPIAAGFPDEQVNVIREDPAAPRPLHRDRPGRRLLSNNGGTSWFSLCANLPPAAVHDIAIQARERELVIATHGRSVFKIDLVPIQEFSERSPPRRFTCSRSGRPAAAVARLRRRLGAGDPASGRVHVLPQDAGPVSLRIFDDKGRSSWSVGSRAGRGSTSSTGIWW